MHLSKVVNQLKYLVTRFVQALNKDNLSLHLIPTAFMFCRDCLAGVGACSIHH